MMRTQRLLLRPASSALLRAELESARATAAELGAELAPDWPPPFYDQRTVACWLQRLAAEEPSLRWPLYYLTEAVLPHASRAPVRWRAVGVAGFKHPPDARGNVEISVSIVQTRQYRGLGGEATRALLGYAFAQPEVSQVVAHTLPDLTRSITTLRSAGFFRRGEAAQSQVAEAIRYELSRSEHALFASVPHPTRP